MVKIIVLKCRKYTMHLCVWNFWMQVFVDCYVLKVGVSMVVPRKNEAFKSCS